VVKIGMTMIGVMIVALPPDLFAGSLRGLRAGARAARQGAARGSRSVG
jgi:hypothetical protein